MRIPVPRTARLGIDVDFTFPECSRGSASHRCCERPSPTAICSARDPLDARSRAAGRPAPPQAPVRIATSMSLQPRTLGHVRVEHRERVAPLGATVREIDLEIHDEAVANPPASRDALYRSPGPEPRNRNARSRLVSDFSTRAPFHGVGHCGNPRDSALPSTCSLTLAECGRLVVTRQSPTCCRIAIPKGGIAIWRHLYRSAMGYCTLPMPPSLSLLSLLSLSPRAAPTPGHQAARATERTPERPAP